MNIIILNLMPFCMMYGLRSHSILERFMDSSNMYACCFLGRRRPQRPPPRPFSKAGIAIWHGKGLHHLCLRRRGRRRGRYRPLHTFSHDGTDKPVKKHMRVLYSSVHKLYGLYYKTRLLKAIRIRNLRYTRDFLDFLYF